jgi:hypothetical protein
MLLMSCVTLGKALYLFGLQCINCSEEFHCDISIHVYFDQIHSLSFLICKIKITMIIANCRVI